MKKVFQTMYGRKHGNCLPATVASLLELNLEDVPHFNETNNWFKEYHDFMATQGYEIFSIYNREDARLRPKEEYMDWYNSVKDKPNQLERLKDYEGIDGLFEAAVYSPKHYREDDPQPALHAVIIDKDFNIVHDPNIGYKDIKEYPRAKELGYNGVVDVTVFKKIKP